MNRTIDKLAGYVESHYVSRYWILLIDTIGSVCASLLILFTVAMLTHMAVPFVGYIYLLGIAATASVLSFIITRTYASIIRHTTMRDLVRVAAAAFCKGVFMFFLVMLSQFDAFIGFDVSDILASVLVDVVFTLFVLVLVRVGLNSFYHYLIGYQLAIKKVKPVLIYGEGDEAVSTLSFVERAHGMNYQCVGYISPSEAVGAKMLGGYRVYRFRDEQDFHRLASSKHVKGIIFPTAVAAKSEQDRLLAYCSKLKIKTLIRPSIMTLDDKMNTNLNKVREIRVEDLLGREEIKIDDVQIKEFLADKVVFVTGGAGSIGGQLCRLLVEMPIRKLILIDMAETPLHNMQLELREQSPRVDKKFIIADVRNQERMRALFAKYRPNVVFHAAAYKHVPLMESNPCEAVLANVFGTVNVVNYAVEFDVEKFVMISTDKAVNPTNVMGASKRIAEIYVQTLGRAIEKGLRRGKTKFVTTRFGNVLGSNGSVIPLFREQIAKGGPVTVTDPRIIRYFMTIPEACRLVLEAATLGTGCDIFVFDMGAPVKIDDLAKNMIALAGLELGKDIDIQYVGLRPGEKLYEELLKDEENTLPTEHEKIFHARVREFDLEWVEEMFARLHELAVAMKKDDTVSVMKQIVPEFKSANSRYGRLDEAPRA